MGQYRGGSRWLYSSPSSSSCTQQCRGCRSPPGRLPPASGLVALANCIPGGLIAHDYEDEAFKILADLENKSEDDPFILAQHKEIVYTVQYEQQHAVPWVDLLRGRTGDQAGTKTIRRLLLGAGTQAMQQLSGINVSRRTPLSESSGS